MDNLSLALVVLITGLVVVFAMLILLTAIIKIYSTIIYKFSQRKGDKKKASPDAKHVKKSKKTKDKKNTRKKKNLSASTSDNTISTEIVAVISAAIACMGEKENKIYKINDIVKIAKPNISNTDEETENDYEHYEEIGEVVCSQSNGLSAWTMAGRIELNKPF